MAYPRREHLKGAPIGLALALLSNYKTDWKGFSKDKHFSLLGLIVINEGEKFYNIDTSSPGQRSLLANIPKPLPSTRLITYGSIWGQLEKKIHFEFLQKARALISLQHFQPSLIFVGKAGAYLSEAPYRFKTLS